jgi:hypothetical protein
MARDVLATRTFEDGDIKGARRRRSADAFAKVGLKAC